MPKRSKPDSYHKKGKDNDGPKAQKEELEVPRSFVITHGKVTSSVKKLQVDLREILRPNTTTHLQKRSDNKIKDFTFVAPALGVTHVIVFSQTEGGTYLKVARMPQGPTLTFRVTEYSLAADVRKNQRKPAPVNDTMYHSAPLLVLNGFRTTKVQEVPIQKKRKYDENPRLNETRSEGPGPSTQAIVSTALFSLFPQIDVDTFNVEKCKRVCLFRSSESDPKESTISMRHYAVCRRVAGVSRGIKKLIKPKANPNNIFDLSKTGDVADIVLDGAEGYPSDSEAEDMTTVAVDSKLSSEKVDEKRKILHNSLPGLVASATKKVAVFLKELGPRLELELIKIEAENFTGSVLFHRFVIKSPEELKVVKIRGELAAAKRKQIHKEVEKEIAKQEADRLARKEKRKKSVEKNKGKKKGKESEEEKEKEEEEEEEDMEEEEDDE